MAGLVRHGADRHDLAGVAAALAADAALEDVVRDLDMDAAAVHGVRRVRHHSAKEVLEVGAVRPQMIVARGTARAVERRGDERHQVHIAVAVAVVLRPVHLGVDLLECQPEPVLHPREGVVREQAVAVGAADGAA